MPDAEALFRVVFHESIIPSWIVDAESVQFLEVNAGAVQKYGYQRETFLNNDLRLLRPNDDLRALVLDYARFAENPGLHSRRHRRADGQWLSVDVSVRPANYRGRPVLVAQVLDASALESVREQIEQANSRVTRILRASMEAVVSIDRDSSIIEWSGEAEAIFGWTSKKALGQKMHELIMPERFREMHLEGLNRYFVTGNAKLLDNVVSISALRRSGEEFPINIRITRVDRVSTFDFTAFIRELPNAASE